MVRDRRMRTSIGECSMTIIVRALALATALQVATISATWATDRTIDLRVGFVSSLVLDRAFETVMIGDAKIVDVHTPDHRLVILDPLAPGATNLIFLDDQNIVIANIGISVRQSGW
jgi:Flp pilus assembly secretin CpaC